jgi:hypothetical protein
MVNVGRLQLEIGFRNCRTDIENSREVEFTGKKAEHCYLERDAYDNEAISKNSCWSTICSTLGTAGSVPIDKRRVSISLEGYELSFGNGDLTSVNKQHNLDTNKQSAQHSQTFLMSLTKETITPSWITKHNYHDPASIKAFSEVPTYGCSHMRYKSIHKNKDSDDIHTIWNSMRLLSRSL